MTSNTQKEQQVLELIHQDQLSQLRKLVLGMPLEDALAVCRGAMKKLTPTQRAELWHEIRTTDRFAGILSVADQLVMPQYPVFGPAKMPQGDVLTDYDRARTFILKNRGTTGRIEGSFYPEVMRLSTIDRVIALADAHIGCSPSGQKQLNLFSLCGFYSLSQARATTQPQGTTCALVLRAVLIAAGDSRFSIDMLPRYPHMVRSMGLEYEGNVISGAGWVYALDKTKPLAPPVPSPGDAYYIILPSVILPEPGPSEDSGHIGIVESARQSTKNGKPQILLNTIDGGQKNGSSPGHWTKRNRREFTKDAPGRWLQQDAMLTISGHKRILVGWVSMASVVDKFHSNTFLLMDSHRVHAQL